MKVGTGSRQAIKAMIDELPGEALPEAAEFLEALKQRSGGNGEAVGSKLEAELLSSINRRLPADSQRRISDLRRLAETGRMSPDEHAELLEYVYQVEQDDARRAEALVELAKLRNQPLAEVLAEFPIAPPGDAA